MWGICWGLERLRGRRGFNMQMGKYANVQMYRFKDHLVLLFAHLQDWQICKLDYPPIFHLHHPITHLRQFLIMCYDQKRLTQLFSQVNK